MVDYTDPTFDFEEAQKALDRKRKYIAATLAQAPPESGYKGKYYIPPYEQLQKSIIDAAGHYEMGGLDTQGADLASAKNAEIAKLLAQEPQDIPAQPGRPEVVGTGPLAPPPGTPGVEPTPPPAPAGEADAMPPVANNMSGDSPAGWVGPGNQLDMVDRGTTGANFLPNKAGVEPTPLIPRTLSDMTKWAGKFSRFGDVGDITKEAIKFGIQQPERAQLAREAQAGRNAEALRRYEDKMADNKRDQQRVDEIIRSNKSTEEERQRAHKESERLQGEAIQARKDAAALVAEGKAQRDADKLSDKQKQIHRDTRDYEDRLNKEKLEPLDALLTGVEKELSKYELPQEPGAVPGDKKYKSIPGVGAGTNIVSEAFLSPEGMKMHRAIIPLQRMITAAEAGLSQTASEMKGVMDNLARSGMSPEEAFPIAIQKLREIVNLRRRAISSGFEPEAVDIYHRRSGTPNPRGGQEEAVQVKSKAQYDALPKGTLFIPEDGSAPRRK